MVKNSRRAFALIEVVIAGIILAIGLGSVVSLAARAMMDQQRGERAVMAAMINSTSVNPRRVVLFRDITALILGFKVILSIDWL